MISKRSETCFFSRCWESRVWAHLSSSPRKKCSTSSRVATVTRIVMTRLRMTALSWRSHKSWRWQCWRWSSLTCLVSSGTDFRTTGSASSTKTTRWITGSFTINLSVPAMSAIWASLRRSQNVWLWACITRSQHFPLLVMVITAPVLSWRKSSAASFRFSASPSSLSSWTSSRTLLCQLRARMRAWTSKSCSSGFIWSVASRTSRMVVAST